MADSIVSNITVRVLEFLGQSAVERIAPYFGGRGRLNELQLTLEMIQARLFDAERRQEVEEGALIRSWLKGLKRVMYRLEDLLEDVTMAEQHDEQRASSKLNKVVRFFPSKFRLLKMNKRLFDEAQDIMKELDRITSNMDRFHFNVHPIDQERGALNMVSWREETYSFIREEEVIGRDEDKKVILSMLLECDDVKEDLSVILSVIPIVGMGGLGKTTLAQLVFNDKHVEQHFELKSWVCITDQISSFKELAGKVLHSITGKEWQCLNTEQLQLCLRQAVNGKKFLLVLDDMWDENRERWLCLERLLREGKQGSKILVTTRSEVVAKNMGVIKPYVLNILPEEQSWALFKSIAFKDGQQETKPNLISIGKEIVKKCGNVPLAIRTIASLLYSKDTEEEWVHFRDKEIGMIEQTQNDIMPTLRISYFHLVPQQKQCFAYCSLFPKDYTFVIKRLIQLWMAQGFVKSPDDGRICFLELLRRCFFQNVSRDGDDMETCQMHDLMHDLAQTVGDECLLVDGPQENVNDNVRHVHVVNPSWLGSQSSHASPHIRSYLLPRGFMFYKQFEIDLNDIFSSLRRVRALDLGQPRHKRLLDSIGELRHLRYLKVWVTGDYLPSGITRLQYLETLDLEGSVNLRELPTEFYKLTRLKYLQIGDKFGNRLNVDCELVDMPPRFRELISLQSLDTFVVGNSNGVDALSGMNLASELEIYYRIHRQNAISEAKQANMKGKKLTVLYLTFDFWLSSDYRESAAEADGLLECLELPSTLKHLKVRNWKGVRFPNWGIDELPNLVSLKMINCSRCRHLPPFDRLPHIKKLEISGCEELDLWDVKDGDDDRGKGNYVNSSSWACMKSLNSLSLAGISKLESLPGGIFGLTALEKLSICRFHDLKTIPESIGQLTQLRYLKIHWCPKLEALPKSIQNLVGLQELIVTVCPLLEPRCQKPDGEDWALIQHIPRKIVSWSLNSIMYVI